MGTPRSTKTRPRRGNGAGSISERQDGQVLYVRVSLPNGSRPKATVRRMSGESVADHRRRAEAELRRLQANVEQGQTVAAGGTTVERYAADWLRREWAFHEQGQGRAANTIDHHRLVLANYVVPYVGTRPLPDLTVQDVDRMLCALVARGLSQRTVTAARNTLRLLLKDARREGLLVRVVTDDARLPRRQVDEETEVETKALAPGQVKALFAAAEGTRWFPVLASLAFLGLRRGEALGLRWSDIDFDAGRVVVRRALVLERVNGVTRLHLGPTKTKGSRRTLALPPALAVVLRAWRAEQHRERLACGVGWGVDGGWTDTDLVFTNPIGQAVHPDSLRSAMRRIGEEAGVGHVYPYQLRHSFASLAIEDGYSAPEVADLMGHSSPATTLAFYAHSFAARQETAIASVAARYHTVPAGAV